MNATTSADSSVEEFEARYNSLVKRGNDLERDKNKVEAELSSRRRSLKDNMEQARKDGFDPNQLPEEIRRSKEVLATKLDLYSTDLDAAEKVMRPMIAEVQRT